MKHKTEKSIDFSLDLPLPDIEIELPDIEIELPDIEIELPSMLTVSDILKEIEADENTPIL